MAASCLWFIFVITFIPREIYSGGPPEVTGSYKATGEMAEVMDDETKILIQLAFEESFDAETQNAAFNAWIMGKNVTYFENYKTGQTFKYTEGKDCQQVTLQEWMETDSPPSLIKYEDTNGTVRFSLKQLFSLDKKYLKEEDKSGVFRGIPAKYWMYEIKEADTGTKWQKIVRIYSYWSEPSWNTTSNEDRVPLGFIVSNNQYRKGKNAFSVHEQFINIFSFVPKAIDHRLFEPIQGVVCANKTKTIPFPDVNNIKAISLRSEVIFPDYQEIKYVDTWFDPLNKMVRMDSERIKDEDPTERTKRKYQSEMVLGKAGVAFRLTNIKDLFACTVIPIKEFDLDIQNLINFKEDIKNWSVGKMFGLNQTSYTYIGKTSKRDIPCHLFQGIRTDWPEPAAKVESLWEWCFSLNITTKDDAVIFKGGDYGLVNVQVVITKSGTPSYFPPNFRIFHHFYDVKRIEPTLTDASNFDIGHCFDEGQKRRLQFVVDWAVTDENVHEIENATSDVLFLRKWKEAIYQFGGLDPNMLRLSGVSSVVLDKQLIVRFTILSPHPGLPEDILKKQVSAFTAENTLRDKINARGVAIYYSPKKGTTAQRIGVLPHSMNFQVNTTFQPHIPPSTTTSQTTISTRVPFTLIPDPDEGTSSTRVTNKDGSTPDSSTHGPTHPPDRTTISPEELKKGENLHKAGTVATVSIAMLLMGISIGSAGVFIKNNGLPQCLKCGGT